jgi:hypothetical protein
MIVVFCLVACKLYSLYLEIQSYSVALSALACASRESRVVTRQRVESDEFEPPGVSQSSMLHTRRAPRYARSSHDRATQPTHSLGPRL